MAHPRMRSNRLPAPPRPLSSRVHGPSRQGSTESAIDHVRRVAREKRLDDKPFDPTKRGTWHGSSRDLVVNGKVEDECIVITLDNDESYGSGVAIANPFDVPRGTAIISDSHPLSYDLFVFQFGAYGWTKVAVWCGKGKVERALEIAAEWLSTYAPGIFQEVESEEDTTDMTYTEYGYIASWEWTVDELGKGHPLYQAALIESHKAYDEEYGVDDDSLNYVEGDSLKANKLRRNSTSNLNPFQLGFLEAALWSSSDNADDSGGEPLDANYDISDFDPAALASLLRDCDSFEADNEELLAQAGDRSQNGHDFWLTRCGHGAGFWDRGYSKRVGDALTRASKAYGNVDLTVGDDGQIYI